MTQSKLAQKIKEIKEYFLCDTRTNGEEFSRLKDEAPEWLREAMIEIAQAKDSRWTMVHDFIVSLAGYDIRDNDHAMDLSSEVADGCCPVYNRERLDWLSEDDDNLEAVDDELQNGIGAASSLVDLIGIAYVNRCRDLGEQLLQEIIEQVEEEGEE